MSVRRNMREWAGSEIGCQDVLMRLKQQVTPGQKQTQALICYALVVELFRSLSGETNNHNSHLL